MKNKSTQKLAKFQVGMLPPIKLSKKAVQQLATSVTPPRALALAAKAANIARKSEEKKHMAATA